MGRVAGYLAEMAKRHGRPLDGGIEIGVALSQEELAGYIVGASSRESVARALMTLRKRGLITTVGAPWWCSTSTGCAPTATESAPGSPIGRDRDGADLPVRCS